MRIIKITKQAEIAQIPTNEPIQLEIYLKGASIPLEEIDGNCLVRAIDCSFPNLEKVNGSLSVDASHANFPKLTVIQGNCNIHEAYIQLPVLKEVKGNLVVLNLVDLWNLELLGGKIKNKAKVEFPKLYGDRFQKPTYTINALSDIKQLPENGYFNLTVRVPNVIIPHTEILGTVTINVNNVQFPNLVNVFRLIVDIPKNDFLSSTVSFPQLKLVLDNCILNVQEPKFGSLEKVGKHLFITESYCIFSNLKEVGSLQSQTISNSVFPKLELITGDLHYKFKTWTKPQEEPSVPQKTGVFSTLRVLFNNKGGITKLEEEKPIEEKNYTPFPVLKTIIGNAELNETLTLPQLKSVSGKVTINTQTDTTFPLLEHISILQISRCSSSLSNMLPSIKTINKGIIDTSSKTIIEHIEIPYYKINNSLYLSKNDFFLASRSTWTKKGSLITDNIHYPITMLVAIFKMRHSSIQNFFTREYSRERLLPTDDSDLIWEILKTHWDKTKVFTFEDIFKISDFNLRRFCFNYIGVSEMMRVLEATRIASDGIELDYYRYDEQGIKIPYKKHNIYEIYEADINKIKELNNWRDNNRKVYAVKCWCSSTNHEHWLWVEEKYKYQPLEAIASTFRIHENVIPHIKCLKRQGDILLCEMKQNIIPEGRIRPLTKEEYFGLLEVET